MDQRIHFLFLSLLVCVAHYPILGTALRCYSCENTATSKGCQYLQSEGTNASSVIDCATQCYSVVSLADDSVVVRGCLGANSQCDTSPLSLTKCSRCVADLCNSEQLIQETCASCDSNAEENCRTTSIDTRISQCVSTIEKSGCFHLSSAVDGSVRRGCISDLEVDLLDPCTSGNGDSCRVCYGNNCNLKDSLPMCFTCDSTTDANCLNLDPQVNTEFISVCKDYSDTCAAYVIPNGETVRGCSKEINPEPTFCPSTNCEVCSGPLCNSGYVPANRIQCFQCNSTEDNSCLDDQFEGLQNLFKPCPTYRFDDQCYKYLDPSTGIGYRGCLSDADEVVNLCLANPEQCSICSNFGCNSGYLLRNPNLWCIQCDKNPACMWSYRTPTRPCGKRVAFYETESCFSYLYPGGTTAKRGCSLDEPQLCNGDNSTCQTCSSFFCNGASYLKQSCIRCNSLDSELCEEGATEVVGEECVVEPTYSERGCYSFRDDQGTVFRGCSFDMEDQWRKNCSDFFKDRCTRCYGDNCNTNLQGSGIVNKPGITFVSLLISTGLLFLRN